MADDAREAYAVVGGGKIKKIVITEPGSGYSSPPQAVAKGFEKVHLDVKLAFGTDLKKNGRVALIDVVPPKPPKANQH